VDEREVDAFRAYVRQGGSLYASKHTSLVTSDGTRHADFMLSDVLGVSYQGETRERFTYIAPQAGHERLYGAYTRRHPPGLQGSQLMVEAKPGAQVLGELVLPYTDPADPIHFASIHNNPPGIYTGDPAIVLNRFGQGRTLYVGGDLESAAPHRDLFANLIRLLGEPFSCEMDAPKSVEITLFDDREHQRFIVNLINLQKELPNIPVEDIRVRIRLNGRVPGRLLFLPEERAIPYTTENGCVVFTAPRLETYAMFALEVRVQPGDGI